MNELERILALPKEDRTQADLDYLEAHKDELSEEQVKQLESEKETPEPNEALQKKIGQKSFARFDAVIEEIEDGLLRAIVNSGKEDRHGEILDIRGLDIKEYMKNPILANSHDYSKPSVGVTKKLTKKADGSLVADFKFATDVDKYDEPKILDGLYRKGYQFAFSIGFIPHEIDGNTFTKSTMVEFSPVLIPADGNALLLAKKKGLDKEILEAYNYSSMNEIQKILAKVEKDGIDSLTIAEIKYLNEHQDDLTPNQVKDLSSVLKTAEPEKDETKEAIKALTEKLEETTKELAEVKKLTVETKDINGQHNVNINLGENHKMFGNTKVDKRFLNDKEEVAKELKFFHYVKGLQTGNFDAYRDVIGKAAMNTSGNVVLPPQEFILEIARLEEEVGVAERFANVKRSSAGAGVKYVMGDDDLEIFDTDEGGKKKSTKLTYKQLLLGWKKWAGILPITDELTEDSAVDLWADATSRFSRAFARKGDQLVFTANGSGGNNKKGIMYASGTHVVHAGGTSFDDIDSDDLVDMIFGVPSASAANGRFWLNREALSVIYKLKDEENRPLWLPSVAQGAPATILGKPYTEVDVLPTLDEEEAGLPVIAFGDLKYATLGIRTDLQIKIFDTGSVGDPDDADQDDASDINLLTDDVQAMRAVKRMNAVVRFPEAFSVLKLDTNS